MELPEEFKITFIKWKKYQKEYRYDKVRWFAFHNDFFTNSNFLDFTHSERVFFIYLLCQISMSNGRGSYVIRTSIDCRLSVVKKCHMISCINKLIHREIVELHNITLHNTKKTPTPLDSVNCELVDNLVDNSKKENGEFINEHCLKEDRKEFIKQLAKSSLKVV